MSYRSDKADYESALAREKLNEHCQEAMDILDDHFGSETEINEAYDLKCEIEYYEDKIKDLKEILMKMSEIENKMSVYPEAYDIVGNR